MANEVGLLTKRDLEVLGMLARRGTEDSARGLTEMIGREVLVSVPKLEMVPLSGIPMFFGGPEALVVGVYLSIEGDLKGHIMLALPYDRALNLVDMLMDQPPGTTVELDDLERSALGEAGNIVSSFFLTSMAHITGTRLLPSPPAVTIDMAGAILSAVLVEIALERDEALVIDTSFSGNGHDVQGYFLLLADADALQTIARKVE